jgi:signal peptidase I
MDFSLAMLLALIACGLIWGFDRLVLAPRRRAAAERAGPPGAPLPAGKEPMLVEYARAFFPVILLVFLLRSFLVEPFRIPSGSMLPSLRIGDFILVNKYVYGLRLPVVNRKIIEMDFPRRGDVIVFRFPGDNSINYIKRVAGVAGDRIVYRDKQLYVNGRLMEQTAIDGYIYSEAGDQQIRARRLQENLDGTRHEILLVGDGAQAPIEFTVPPGQYFVMGDNRDRSNDSRYWGTVPEENVVGRAFMIWFSWDVSNGGGVLWNRIGSMIH